MKRFVCVTVVLAAALAACGGGGGSSSTPIAAAPVTPASVPASVRRSDIQVALTSVQTSTLLSQFGASTANGGTSAAQSARRTILRALRDARARRNISAVSACTNSTTQDFTSTGPGKGNLIETLYFDSACTQKHEVLAAVVNGTADTVDGTFTVYDRSGNVTANETLHAAVTISTGVDTVMVGLTPLTTGGAAAGFALDLTCSLGTTAATLACGAAAATTLSDASMIGSSLAFTGSTAAVANGESLTFHASANAYTGASGTLSLAAGAGTMWNVVGGTLVASDSVSGSVTSSTSGQTTAVALTANDATYSDTVTLNGSASGISLSEVLGTTTLATATLDASGNGVITYIDGSQNTVHNFTIVAS